MILKIYFTGKFELWIDDICVGQFKDWKAFAEQAEYHTKIVSVIYIP